MSLLDCLSSSRTQLLLKVIAVDTANGAEGREGTSVRAHLGTIAQMASLSLSLCHFVSVWFTTRSTHDDDDGHIKFAYICTCLLGNKIFATDLLHGHCLACMPDL